MAQQRGHTLQRDTGQRFMVQIDITVNGNRLTKRPPGGELLTLIQIQDNHGRVYQGDGSMSLHYLSPEVRWNDILYTYTALVLPGDYRLTVALVHSASGDHNLAHAALHVEPLYGDPLPNSWDGLPPIEIVGFEKDAIAQWFHPDMTGRLHLPVENRLPLRIELLVNLPGRWNDGSVIGTILPQLKVLSQIALRNGVLNITLLDTRHHQAIAVTRHGRLLDWDAIKAALERANPDLVDVHALGVHISALDFLIEELHRRLQGIDDPGPSPAPIAAGAIAPANNEEHRTESRPILVLIDQPRLFQKDASWKPALFDEVHIEKAYLIRDYPRHRKGVAAPRAAGLAGPIGNLHDPSCTGIPDCRSPLAESAGRIQGQTLPIDRLPPTPRGTPVTRRNSISLQQALSNLEPRIFDVKNPLEFREALAAILADLSKM